MKEIIKEISGKVGISIDASEKAPEGGAQYSAGEGGADRDLTRLLIGNLQWRTAGGIEGQCQCDARTVGRQRRPVDRDRRTYPSR